MNFKTILTTISGFIQILNKSWDDANWHYSIFDASWGSTSIKTSLTLIGIPFSMILLGNWMVFLFIVLWSIRIIYLEGFWYEWSELDEHWINYT